ncbi:ORF6N domain-containing protein [Pedobacter petrophilus]|uniref:ORF6N domain-containing protein n=1 Tax=Pedobacter petrophilus TaxID=1908241 RepID=UPI001AE0188C|nr:ORF6N domain-containing protein [Pedobacter petrophilus]
MQIIKSIESKIYTIRDERVMLDFDLAWLYEVETKVLNQAVKRNLKRFPDDFMFQLSANEWLIIVAQNEKKDTFLNEDPNRSQIVTGSQKHRGNMPYAFTEQGVAMLSGVLKSDKAINMNIAI